MKQVLAFLGARLSEPSSWAGLAALMVAGLAYPDSRVQLISLVLIVLCAGLSFFLPEKMRVAEIGALQPLEARALTLLPLLASVPGVAEHPLAARVVAEAARQLLTVTVALPASDPPAAAEPAGASTVSGAAAAVLALLVCLPLLGACGAAGTLQGGQPALAEQAVALPQQAANIVIPAQTPQQRALRLYALCTIIADDASARAVGDVVLASAVYGGLSVAQQQLDALRTYLKVNPKPVLLNTKMFLAASALMPPVKAVAKADSGWILGQIANPNVLDILGAVEGAAQRGALGINETADAVAQMKDIQARPNPDPVDADFQPWAERIQGALDMLRPVAARPSS